MKGKGVGVQIDFVVRCLRFLIGGMRRASTQGVDSLHQCLGFFSCCCDKTKHNLRDKGYVWLTVLGYSPLWQGSCRGRGWKKLVAPNPVRRRKSKCTCISRHAHTQLALSIPHSLRSPAQRILLPTTKVGLLTSTNNQGNPSQTFSELCWRPTS